MKSNDNIPTDEMLLAEACAAAKVRRLEWTALRPFERNGRECIPTKATHVCALGAMHLAGLTPLRTALFDGGRPMVHGLFSMQVWSGNDKRDYWSWALSDNGESLGWAFRCFMTQNESDPETERLIRERRGK